MMKWSERVELAQRFKGLPLGRLFGVPIVGDWWWCAILMVLCAGNEPLLVIGLYMCLVAHEFGHILMARRYGVPTIVVQLWVLGGVAMMQFLPRKPREEFWVCLTGPLVSLVLGLSLVWLPGDWGTLGKLNLTLAFFNLLPVFPMDGGRIYRSLLAMRWPRVRATTIAVRTAQVMSLGFVAFAIWDLDYIIVGLFTPFIAFMSQMELRHERESEVLDRSLAKRQAQFGPDDEQFWALACLRREVWMHPSPAVRNRLVETYEGFVKASSKLQASQQAVHDREQKRKQASEQDGFLVWYEAHRHEWEGVK